LPCLRCGGPSEEDSLLCDGCADACFLEPKLFLNPTLVGHSVYAVMREQGSAAQLLGPAASANFALMPSADLQKSIKEVSSQALRHEDLKVFHDRCNMLLANIGVPIKLDQSLLLLTEDAAETITAVVQKVNAVEEMFPIEAMSDLYLRVGVVYWGASRGVLFRVSSKKWRTEKREYLLARAKTYFAKIPAKDDLYSIAERNLGMLFLEAQEWSDAEEHLSNALLHFPSDQTIAESLARAHLELGNTMESLSRVDESLAQGEASPLWILKGRIMRDMGRNEEAVECFNRALALDPKKLEAHDLLIRILRDTGRSAEASLAEGQRALSKKPDLEERVAEFISELKKGMSEPEVPRAPSTVARKRLEPAGEGLPSRPEEPRLISPRGALDKRDYDLAIQRAQESLVLNPNDRDAALVIIEALVSKGKFSAAAEKANAFYEKHRNDAVSWHWRGVIAEREDKWGAAIQYFSKAVSLDPGFIDSWVEMGDTLFSNNKLNGADESFSRALQIDPDNARAWLGKARVMNALGRWGAAIQCYDKYSALQPKDRDVWIAKADLLFDKEKFRRAIEAYDEYLKLAQDDSHALGRKGISLNALGLTDEAKKCLEEAVRLDANNKEAAKWLKVVSGGGR